MLHKLLPAVDSLRTSSVVRLSTHTDLSAARIGQHEVRSFLVRWPSYSMLLVCTADRV